MLCLKLFTLINCAILLSTVTDVVQGKYIYQSDVQKSIGQNKVVATWEEAKQRCERDGAVLASPIDEKLLKHMLTYIDVNNHTNSYFIGIKAKYNPKPQFLSAEGILLNDLPEVVLDMIDQLDPREGDCLAMNRVSIRVVHCWDRLPYICYTKVKTNETVDVEEEIVKPTEPEPTTTETATEVTETATEVTETATEVTETATEITTPVPECDYEGYEYNSVTQRCYKLHTIGKIWSDANTTCDDEGGYLVIVNDAKEAKALREIIKVNHVYLRALWIGHIDETGNGDWRSIHGDPIDKIYHLRSDYKRTYSKPYACGILLPDKIEFDKTCESHLAFVCEKSL